jgi:uncharacterized protein (TIGR02246 family)
MAVEDTLLQQRLDDVDSILTSGDADRIGNLYTQDGQLLPPGSDFVTGRDAIADFWQGVGEAGGKTVEIEPREVEVYEDTAMRVCLATLHDSDSETIDEVKFIEIWKQDDDAWRIHRDIWNSNIATEQ